MKILTTGANFMYACEELRTGLKKALGPIISVKMEVARDYSDLDKTLVIFLGCPCCSRLECEIQKGDILVSPLCGIDTAGYKIEVIPVYPPFQRDDGSWEGCDSWSVYSKEWRVAIDRAIKKVCPEYVRKEVKEDDSPMCF